MPQLTRNISKNQILIEKKTKINPKTPHTSPISDPWGKRHHAPFLWHKVVTRVWEGLIASPCPDISLSQVSVKKLK